MSWNCDEKLKGVNLLSSVSSREAHPSLTIYQLAATSMLWPLFQGNQQMYFCGSSVLPGNGHDLSLLSGFVAASALGADFPFLLDPLAEKDFFRLRKMMFWV